MEIWADIPIEELKERYQVSNLGNIRTIARHVPFGLYTGTRPITRHLARIENDKQGYSIFKAGNKNRETKHYLVHRLVALAFLPPALEGENEVNHKDGIKANNCVENLEWLSHGENERHAFAIGLKHKGKEHHWSINRARPWIKAWWAKMTPEERSARGRRSAVGRYQKIA